jgi:predicted nucleotidyltransferase
MGSAVKSKGDIRNRLRRHKDRLHSLGVEKLGLFGSFVRDEQKTREPEI